MFSDSNYNKAIWLLTTILGVKHGIEIPIISTIGIDKDIFESDKTSVYYYDRKSH